MNRGSYDVLHYTHAVDRGSGGYVRELVANQAALGYRICLVCPSDFDHGSPEVELSGARVLHGPRSVVGGSGRSVKVARLIIQVIGGTVLIWRNRRAADVVHFNFVGIPGTAVPLLVAARAMGLKTVWTIHDLEPHRSRFPACLRSLERLLTLGEWRLADRLIVHHEAALHLLRGRSIVAARRAIVIPHAAPAVRATTYPDRGSSLRLLVIGVIRANKGVEKAIQAVQQLRREGLPLELTIAGAPYKNEQEYWARCRRRLSEAPDGFHVVDGSLSDCQFDTLIAQSHAVVLPYERFDSQSGVAVRALAHGRPIVATRVGGLGELLSAGEMGVAIEGPSVDDVRAALRKTSELGYDNLREMGDTARAFADTRLSPIRVAQAHKAVYDELRGS